MAAKLVHMLGYIIQFSICQLPTSWLRIFSPRVAVLALLMISFCPSSLAVGIGGMFRPYLDYTVVADDNILRIRDGIDARTLLGTSKLSDISQSFVGGVIFEKEISRQRLSANVNYGQTKFVRFNQIDSSNRDLRGNWNWFLGNNFSGNLGVSNVRALAPFTFFPGVRNLQTTQTEYFNIAWHFHPRWHLSGDYTHFDINSDTDISSLGFLSRTENRFKIGLDYITPNESSIGIQLSTIRGDFPKPLLAPDGTFSDDNSFDQNEVKAHIKWIVTGKSQLHFLGGWIERKNASFTSRNFSGFNARLIYSWQPTGKIGLTLNGWRENAPVQSLRTRFSLNTGISLIPTWDLTEKVKIEGDFSYRTIKSDGFTNRLDGFALGRNNTLRNVSTKLTYSLHGGMQVSVLVFHNNLTTDLALGGFSANGANINLRYILGAK